jgi:transposase
MRATSILSPSTGVQLVADRPASISDLQVQWQTLSDLERGRAINAIHLAGTSFRQLANKLGRSATLIRHLNQAAQAPAGDQYLAREGKITTNELVRRAKAAGGLQDAKRQEVLKLARAQAAREACREICNWLAAESLLGSLAEQTVDEARRQLAMAEWTGKLPKDVAPPGMSTAEIIRRGRPQENKGNEFPIGDRNLGRTTPKRFQSEHAFEIYAMQQECSALRDHALFSNAARSKDEGLIEELLGELPMVRGCPAADVALTKECGN